MSARALRRTTPQPTFPKTRLIYRKAKITLLDIVLFEIECDGLFSVRGTRSMSPGQDIGSPILSGAEFSQAGQLHMLAPRGRSLPNGKLAATLRRGPLSSGHPSRHTL